MGLCSIFFNYFFFPPSLEEILVVTITTLARSHLVWCGNKQQTKKPDFAFFKKKNRTLREFPLSAPWGEEGNFLREKSQANAADGSRGLQKIGAESEEKR